MRPLLVSKVNTAMQISLVALVLAELGLGFAAGPYQQVLIYLVAATTIVSGGSYIVTWGRNVESKESGVP